MSLNVTPNTSSPQLYSTHSVRGVRACMHCGDVKPIESRDRCKACYLRFYRANLETVTVKARTKSKLPHCVSCNEKVSAKRYTHCMQCRDQVKVKGPGWMSKLPTCADCGVRLSGMKNVRCKPCFNKTDERKAILQKAMVANATRTGAKHRNWKGANVGYQGLHNWVIRRLGQPRKCEDCGVDGLCGSQIHWANVDHQYKRNLTDWLRLCAKCHKNYDLTSNA